MRGLIINWAILTSIFVGMIVVKTPKKTSNY